MDEAAAQILRCQECGFEGMGVYQEERHGAIDSEYWLHHGYELSAADLALLRAEIEQCPDRRQLEVPVRGALADEWGRSGGRFFRLCGPSSLWGPDDCPPRGNPRLRSRNRRGFSSGCKKWDCLTEPRLRFAPAADFE